MTLSGVEIVDHWQNPATGEFFALARLDLDAFTNNLDKVKALDQKVTSSRMRQSFTRSWKKKRLKGKVNEEYLV